MSNQRAVIVHNAAAGAGDIDPAAVTSAVSAHGFGVDYISVDEGRWHDAVRDADLVVAVGGDGTLRQVFVAVAGSAAPVAVVPGGTANNIARSLGLPTDDPLAALDRLDMANIVRFDVPVLRVNGSERRFVETAGAGLFAELLADRVDDTEGTDGGMRRLSELVDDAETLSWQITADGVDRSGDYIAVEAMNINESGPNILLAPAANIGDGEIDLVLLEDGDRPLLQQMIASSARSIVSADLGFQTVRCRGVEFCLPRGARLRCDDQVQEARPTEHISIAVDGAAVRVMGAAAPGAT